MIGMETPKAANVSTRAVRAGGRELFVAEAGQGAAVVLLHGGGPGAKGLSNYSRNIDALARRFRVIVPDLPGYGRSSKRVDGGDPFGFLAGSVRELLDELQIDRAHLVGNSYGGAPALRPPRAPPQPGAPLGLPGPRRGGTTPAP